MASADLRPWLHLGPSMSFCTGELPALKERPNRPIHQTSKWNTLRIGTVLLQSYYMVQLIAGTGICWNDLCESVMGASDSKCGSGGLKQALFPLASLAFGTNALMDKARKRWLSQLLPADSTNGCKCARLCQQPLNYIELVCGPNIWFPYPVDHNSGHVTFA